MRSNQYLGEKQQQRIHREELKLARLKKQAAKFDRDTTNLKLRLANFLFHLGWETLPEQELLKRFERCTQTLSQADDDERMRLQELGASTLQSIKKSTAHQPHSDEENAEQRIIETDRKIQLGQLFLNSGVHNFDRTTLFGSLIELNQMLR